jgi:hypothetical protein
MAFEAAFMSNGVVQRYRDHVVAGEAARAGLAMALSKIQDKAAWTAGFSSYLLGGSRGTFSMTFNQSSTMFPPSTNNLLSATSTCGYDGRTVPPYCAYLISTGIYRNARAKAESLVKIANVPPVRYAVSGNGSLRLNGVATDSWNSSQGSYAATRTLSGGTVCSDSAARNAITIRNGSGLYGDAVVAPGGSSSSVRIDGRSTLSGSVIVSTDHLSLPQAVPDVGSNLGDQNFSNGSYTINPGTYDALGIYDATLTLSSGAYIFSSISSSGANTIRIVDAGTPVYLYSTGSISLQSVTVDNSSKQPKNFWLVGTRTCRYAFLSPANDAHMVVYAPRASVTISGSWGGNLFGGVVGNSVSCEHLSIHYDSTLNFTPGPRGGLQVLARWGD